MTLRQKIVALACATACVMWLSAVALYLSVYA